MTTKKGLLIVSAAALFSLCVAAERRGARLRQERQATTPVVDVAPAQPGAANAQPPAAATPAPQVDPAFDLIPAQLTDRFKLEEVFFMGEPIGRPEATVLAGYLWTHHIRNIRREADDSREPPSDVAVQIMQNEGSETKCDHGDAAEKAAGRRVCYFYDPADHSPVQLYWNQNGKSYFVKVHGDGVTAISPLLVADRKRVLKAAALEVAAVLVRWGDGQVPPAEVEQNRTALVAAHETAKRRFRR